MEVEKRKLIKFSNYSLCITLPKWLLTQLDWKKGDEVSVEIDADSGRLIVHKDTPSSKKSNPNNLRW